MLISGFASIELAFHVQMHSWIDDMLPALIEQQMQCSAAPVLRRHPHGACSGELGEMEGAGGRMKKDSIPGAQERSDSAAGGIDLEDGEAVVEVARCSQSRSSGFRNWGSRRWAARASTPATHPGEEVKTAGTNLEQNHGWMS